MKIPLLLKINSSYHLKSLIPDFRWSVLFSGAVSILAAEVVLEWEEKQGSKWEDTGGAVHVYFSLKVNIQISLISGY